jgi:hypothetical protein
MKLCAVKDHGHTYMFYMSHYFFLTELLNMAVVRNSGVMLGQMLNHFV